ncbi:Severe Depolymerization of Actin [Serendipita sp. 398]|nr:Severe Depolymerization of Actin [Serendipita sp. 398]
MGKQHNNRGALLASNLPQLQNLIKRDPQAYREEFLQQWNHFQSILRIWRLQPDAVEEGQHLRELVSFMAQSFVEVFRGCTMLSARDKGISKRVSDIAKRKLWKPLSRAQAFVRAESRYIAE